MGRREEREADESTVTISFPEDPKLRSNRHDTITTPTTRWGRREQFETDQLAACRKIALHNRRVKTRARLEEKISQLKLIMGDLNNEFDGTAAESLRTMRFIRRENCGKGAPQTCGHALRRELGNGAWPLRVTALDLVAVTGNRNLAELAADRK